MERKYQIGDKITPINKTPRIRQHDNCGTYYQRLERNQDFLYVVGFDEEEEQRLKMPCYWCNVVPNLGGDSFAEKDIIPYEEKEGTGYKVIGTREVEDKDGNKVFCEVREWEGMTEEEIEDMMQEMTVINNKGEKEVIDLRYQ